MKDRLDKSRKGGEKMSNYIQEEYEYNQEDIRRFLERRQWYQKLDSKTQEICLKYYYHQHHVDCCFEDPDKAEKHFYDTAWKNPIRCKCDIEKMLYWIDEVESGAFPGL
jgi:hypothetical protein